MITRLRSTRIVVPLVAVVVAGWLAAAAVRAVYLAPRGALRDEVATARASLDACRAQLDRAAELESDITEFVDRTLGGDQQIVDHRLRSRLNRVAEEIGVASVSVVTGNASPRRSPARTAFRRGGPWRALRDEVDFVEIEGSIGADGTLAQVLRLVDRVESEPWLKHVHHLGLEPKGNGDVFRVTIRLTTLFLPGRAPVARPDREPYDATRLARLASLVEVNPFRVPSPPAPAPVVTSPIVTPVAPPPFPWGTWSVTGVASSAAGVEVWVTNAAIGEARKLAIGDSLGAATLVGAEGEWAEFREAGVRFRVRIGHSMDDRSPVDRSLQDGASSTSACSGRPDRVTPRGEELRWLCTGHIFSR